MLALSFNSGDKSLNALSSNNGSFGLANLPTKTIDSLGF